MNYATSYSYDTLDNLTGVTQFAFEGGIHYEWFDDTTSDDNGKTAYDRALNAGYSAVTFDESKDFTFANGVFAPGETITVVKLGTDGTLTLMVSCLNQYRNNGQDKNWKIRPRH